MKQLVVLFALALTMPVFSQSMKMVVDASGKIVGRYVRTNADSYTVGVQDIFEIPRTGHKVMELRAKNGQGVIWCKTIGRVSVYRTPTLKGDIIGHLIYEEGYVPETYRCLGTKKCWYKVKINNQTGYVPKDSVQWDGMDTF